MQSPVILAHQILKAIAPDTRTDSLSSKDLIMEGLEAGALVAEEWAKGQVVVDAEIADSISQRQRSQYAFQLRSVDEMGKWAKHCGEDGAAYFPAEHNPYAIGDIRCENCVHWAGGECEVVEGDIEPDGICKLWIISQAELVPWESAMPYTADSLRLDGNILKWKGLSIGVTHRPGEQRFQYGVPMSAYYGRINRSWGKARDGKALDVYISPDFDPETDNNPVWRIWQRNEEGLVEEEKLGIGFPTAGAFRDNYIYHVGAGRFGMIEAIDPSTLDPYRADAAYHADSCGCEACSTKQQKPRQKRRKKAEEEVREDAEENPEDAIANQAVKQAESVLKGWITATREWAKGFSSLEDMRGELQSNPKALFDAIPAQPMEDIIYQHMMLGDLGGRSLVLDEEQKFDSILSDSLLRLDARRPEWLRMPFLEAIQALRDRIIIPADSYKEMDEGYHDWAFSVANMTRADLVQAVRFIVQQGIENGVSYDDQIKMWNRLIARQGWKPGKGQKVWTIIDTNTRSAIGTGRGKQMLDDAPDDSVIVWRWRDSPNPRESHKELHNKGIRAKSSFWRKCRFPAGFGCRCGGFRVSEAYCKRNNIEILETPPDPELIAEPGFRYPIDGWSDVQRDRIKRESMSKLSPDLQRLVEEQER